MDPDLDIELRRFIRVPRADVWRAWTEPDQLRQWFAVAPLVARVDRLEIRPGGGFVTSVSEDGVTFASHVDSVFLAVEKGAQLVWTNTVDSEWRPRQPRPVRMTAEVRLLDHPVGTEYHVVVRHALPEDREWHEQLGFLDGWATVTDQLVRYVQQHR